MLYKKSQKQSVLLNSYSSMKQKIRIENWKLTLKVQFEHFMTTHHYSNSPNLVILFDYLLSNLVSLPWKLHNLDIFHLQIFKAQLNENRKTPSERIWPDNEFYSAALA